MAAGEDGGATTAPQPAPQPLGQAQQGRGEVLVKEEYRIPRWQLISQPDEAGAPDEDKAAATADAVAAGDGAALDGDADGAEEGSANGGDGGKKERKRGMNKKRPRNMVEQSELFCRAMTLTGECKWADKCKFLHDAKDYLKRKDKDLGPECPMFKRFGQCPSGITCRWAGCHVDAEGRTLKRSEEEGGVIDIPPEINQLPVGVIMQLQKRKYPFVTPMKRDAGKGGKKGGAKAAVAAKVEPGPPTVQAEAPAVAVADGADADAGAAGDVAAAANGEHVTTTEPFDPSPLPTRERRAVDFSNKVYIAPLTTVGNLPFRRVMKDLGADITCGEMAISHAILQGSKSEAPLLRRHPCEDVFGVQLAGAYEDSMARTAEIIKGHCEVDFIDLNLGCPIDLVNNQGMGATLMTRSNRLKEITTGMERVLQGSVPITIKMRTGWDDKKPTAHQLLPQIQRWAAKDDQNICAVMVHGRSRQQRYTRLADWDYLKTVAQSQDADLPRLPLIGNGDIFAWTDYEEHLPLFDEGLLTPCAMLGRGALIKPWLPTEIKEQRHWDISATERLDIMKKFVDYGLEHWGSDQRGVNNTRRFLLEWQSFLYRYVPVGLLDHVPIKINERPSPFRGRNELECLMASPFDKDWVKLSEMLLGPVPEGFVFVPKHKANAWG